MPNKAKIHYCDIGDYLTREQKLEKIRLSKHFDGLDLVEIHPNEHGDWLTARDEAFQTFIPMESEKKFAGNSTGFFEGYSLGVASNKDAFVYSFGRKSLENTVDRMVSFYENQRRLFNESNEKQADCFVKFDSTQIVWTDLFLKSIERDERFSFETNCVSVSMYRPFQKQMFAYKKQLLQRTYRQLDIFPHLSSQNLVICVPGAGGTKDFSPLIANGITDLHFNGDSQCFPLYCYEENKTEAQAGLFENKNAEKYTRKDGISDFIHQKALSQYGGDVTKEDIFYYVYGILHSPEYRERFADDLKKSLPRLPLVKSKGDFDVFSKAGRALADLHLDYENRKPPKSVRVIGAESGNFHVEKMRFGGKGKDKDKTIIQYNSLIRIENIPLEAYQYIVNGKSAVEWIMERYAISTDKASGIVNDPNDWASEHNQPRYILDLVLSLISVSVETMRIVHSLPKVMDKV